ncbi:MAG: DNA polymerase III subunit delta [Treponema sp.]|nr:DNA polymerase III subunit delta [Treponema sp.]MCL2265638.1 DNA polymerase III subunit delta [Treponema sp.]MCL2265645.1 DNA polymerase III subunit delta [Treponema sp.]
MADCSALSAHINMASGAANSYIYLGPELGKKQDAVDSIKKKYPDAETSVFYAGETAANVIADSIQNHSLFAQSRIIIIKNAELIKKKDEIELLASCAKNLESGTSLIFLSDEIRLASGLDDCAPGSNRQVFYEMFEREKNEWVMSFFKREGYTIGKDCVAAILELVENNTEALRRECSRLILFLPKDKPLKTEDIEKWLSHNREESAFTLFSRIACGDLSKALESLSVMLAANEKSQGILAGLAWCFRKLNDYLSLAESGNAGNNFELKKIGLSSPKARDDYAAAARRYSTEAVETCLALTAEYNMLLRSPVSVMENILMDRYILAVVKAGA